MPLPRRAIISITSAHADLFNGSHTTGLFINEALHPFNVFRQAGFEVDLVSETGKYTPDWLSMTPDFLHGEDKDQWEDLNGEFRQKLDHMSTPDKYDGSNYGIFFASAGHAALIDYPTAKGIKRIATEVWANGGIVAAVCHGPAIYQDLLDPATGEPIIKGKTITGFTNEGEDELKIMDTLRSWGNPLVEDTAKLMGATYSRPKGPWDSYSITDGRIVTGTNPQSAKKAAEAVVEEFSKL